MRFLRIRLSQGGSGSEVTLSGQKESDPQLLSHDVKEEVGDEEGATADSLLSQENGRKRRQRQKPLSAMLKPKSRKLECSGDRWSAERYKQAEQSLLEILKAEGAVFGNPITRPLLRVAGRKRIGDTGLLDHLLKHIDGKAAPGGVERFRRWFNTDGIMEYWLESVELADIRREAGVDDPYWVPPSWWKPGSGPLQAPASAAELKLLGDDMANMKRDLEQLVCKRQDPDHTSVLEEMRKEFLGWKAKGTFKFFEWHAGELAMIHPTRKCLRNLLSLFLSSYEQDMYRDLITWKGKTEQQLMEISNSLSSTQATKQHNATLSPTNSERWEDWLQSNNLENIHGEDVPACWLESTDVVHHEQEVTPQNPCTSLSTRFRQMDGPAQDPDRWRELDVLRKEVANLRRELTELAAMKQEEDMRIQSKSASGFTFRQKAESDNSLILLQEMFKELAKWKAKMEQQVMDISATVGSMQAPMPVPVSSFGQSHFYL